MSVPKILNRFPFLIRLRRSLETKDEQIRAGWQAASMQGGRIQAGVGSAAPAGSGPALTNGPASGARESISSSRGMAFGAGGRSVPRTSLLQPLCRPGSHADFLLAASPVGELVGRA